MKILLYHNPTATLKNIHQSKALEGCYIQECATDNEYKFHLIIDGSGKRWYKKLVRAKRMCRENLWVPEGTRIIWKIETPPPPWQPKIWDEL